MNALRLKRFLTPILIICAIGSIPAQMTAQKKWKYELTLGSSMNAGNVDNFNLKNGGSAVRNDSLISFNTDYKFVYSKESGIEKNKGLNATMKFDLYQYDKWSPFLASEFMTNKHKGYDYKISGLTGVKYRIYTKKDTCDYSLSLATVVDRVDYTPKEEKLDKWSCRMSVRPKIRQKLGSAITLLHHSFYQPAIADFSDYLISTNTKVECKVKSYLFIDFCFEYEYRSLVPAEKYKHHDVETEVALKFKF